MQRYKCKIAYDGSQFSGYQIQPNQRTVQGELERVLEKLHKGKETKVFASGRTDAGVHARGQMIHFDSPFSIPEEKWPVALNALLPDEVSVLEVEKADSDFHARFDVTGKEYRYFVYTSKVRDPFRRHYAYHYPYALNLETIRVASQYLLGTHDFTSFCSAKTEVEDRVRELREIEVLEEGDMLVFRFLGNGFLYNMVRILVGTLLQVGSGEIAANEIPTILAKKDRIYAGKTAPPQGLYLWKVDYENNS
ncbi:tRNA pseudouridine(38-40) synthase TruA [Robertmurraya sp. Marseille-Q9965]